MEGYENLLMDECPPDLKSPDDDQLKDKTVKKPACTKGVAMSFGFRRRPTPIAANSHVARRLANNLIIDTNGNGDTEPLTSNAAPSGRTTPRLMPPKKEPNATKVNRFGFRQPQVNRLNKVADLNNPPKEFVGNRTDLNRKNAQKCDGNQNRVASGLTQAGKYTLQTTQLPGPQTIRMIETKTAKTIANTNKKITNHYHEDSSKDGSATEDSGVGSNMSGCPAVENLTCSPTFHRNLHQPRNLEMVVSGNRFDVRDVDDTENCPPLPQLPSAFSVARENRKPLYSSGYVRERASDYQRHLEIDRRRKISITSSEGFSDDYGEEEKNHNERLRSEKTFIKTSSHKSFLKAKPEIKTVLKDDSSLPSSDEHDWTHGGEAMADEVSFSITSSSDESKDKEQVVPLRSTTSTSITTSVQNFYNKVDQIRTVQLSVEDTKFVAAASTNIPLLDDETSPVDSLMSYSESDLIVKRKLKSSSSESKDVNEKLTPPTPGTPTNASNSLSLSDGKDDFLIDDEIADQPALVFEDVINNVSQNNSEGTATIIDSTPKLKRRSLPAVDASPITSRSRKFLHSRTGSLDTLSPCESIASDDLMMDYDYSQSSGLDDFDRADRNSSGYPSLDETIVKMETNNKTNGFREWSLLLNSCTPEKVGKGNGTKARFLRSRTATPTSVPDSPKSADSKATMRSRPSTTSSPLRLSRPGPLSSTSFGGYDSDDSIRLDRSSHTAMKQDIMNIKTMLLKLRRILNGTDEELLMRSETHIPFGDQLSLTNGLFNGLNSNENRDNDDDNNEENSRFMLAEMKKQILFLQGQLEDKEKMVQDLQEQMVKLANAEYTSNSAPASTVCEKNITNAATQTEKIRPISAGPTLLHGSSIDGNVGSLVSANESPRRSRPLAQSDSPSPSRRTPPRLWRKFGEPPSPQRYTNYSSSIPRRANSRTRTPSSIT